MKVSRAHTIWAISVAAFLLQGGAVTAAQQTYHVSAAPKNCRFFVTYRGLIPGYSSGLYYTVAEMDSGSRPGRDDDVSGDLEGFDGARELKNVSSNETFYARIDYHNSDLGGVISRLKAHGCDFYDYLSGR